MDAKSPDRDQALEQDCLKQPAADRPASSAGPLVLGSVCILLLLAFKSGSHAAGIGLQSSDICWLLALGRYMFEHHVLPAADAFSYTMASQHQPYVVYQWLSALIYFGIYKLYRLKGLLLGHALLVALTFIGPPFFIFKRLRSPMLAALPLVLLVLLSASFRFLVNAETFSFSLLFIWLAILWEWRWRAEQKSVTSISKQELLSIGSLFVVMLLWSNLHITFISGLIVLALLVLSEAAQCLLQREAIVSRLLPLILALVAAFLASLINPSGLQLWACVPFLFLSPTNQYVAEFQPVSLDDFRAASSQMYLIPFLVLSAISLYLVFRAMVPALRDGQIKVKQAAIFSPLIIGLALASAASARYAIPYAAIILLCECAYLLRGMDQLDVKNLFTDVEDGMRKLFERKSILGLALVGLFSLHGAYSTIVKYPPSLPQNSDRMTVPAHAIEALSKTPPTGRVLNDAQYGDILIWYLPAVVPVFIDTRLALYGPKLVNDYMTISSCAPGAEQLLKQYKFDWVFFPAEAPISKYLRENHSWAEVYRDKTASIFRFNSRP